MSKPPKDQYFDGIADKFNRNIYGTTKGQLRHLMLLEAMKPCLSTPQRVIEVGGGAGQMAAALAMQGHQVIMTDASADIIELARQHFIACHVNVPVRQQSLQDINDINAFSLVVCHAVLEWLAAPLDALAQMTEQMCSGTYMSLSFFNKDAALFSNLIYGNFDYLDRGMKVKNQVRLNPQHPLSPKEVMQALAGMDVSVEKVSGIRCFHDYLRDKSEQRSAFEQLLSYEKRYFQTEPFCWLGKYIHLLLRKR